MSCLFNNTRDSKVGIATGIWVGGPRNRGSIPGHGHETLSKSTDRSWIPTSLLPNMYWRSSDCPLRITTHLHLVLRSRMSGSISPLPQVLSWHALEKLYLFQWGFRDDFIWDESPKRSASRLSQQSAHETSFPPIRLYGWIFRHMDSFSFNF